MMILLLAQQCNPGHESKSFREIAKDEAAGECISRFVKIPITKFIKRCGPFTLIQLLDQRIVSRQGRYMRLTQVDEGPSLSV